MIIVQYLENIYPDLSESQVRAKLRAALDVIPIERLLVGWNLPTEYIQACVDECQRAGIELYLWQPLLTGDRVFHPRPEWYTVNMDGNPLSGFHGLSEFTFMCPNHPMVQTAIVSHLTHELDTQPYQGIFLDRIRFPSPTTHPVRDLGCFCPHCADAARQHGLDLEIVRDAIRRLSHTPDLFIHVLLDPSDTISVNPDCEVVASFLSFRAHSITRFVGQIADLCHARHLGVGLDCFSPSLACMVGQDLTALETSADWVKIMSYGHTLGPAGLPFEVLGLANWLIEDRNMSEPEALSLLASTLHLPLPANRADLREHGLSSAALELEARRGRSLGIRCLLAGIELVELAGVTHLRAEQIRADLIAFHEAGADGLVLSWDLWLIPSERLQLLDIALRSTSIL